MCFAKNNHWFLDESWEVFSSALVAEVSQMGVTWGHFSRHVAAKVESWKQCLRVHQTLFFRDLRGWFGTCWSFFFKIFSEMGLEKWFYDFLRNWGSSRVVQGHPLRAFQVQVLHWFLMNSQWITGSQKRQEVTVIYSQSGPCKLQTTDYRQYIKRA